MRIALQHTQDDRIVRQKMLFRLHRLHRTGVFVRIATEVARPPNGWFRV